MSVQTVVAVVVSYLLGSIPTGLWLGLWLRRVDIREHGSKNIGATNTLRVLGKGLGILALLGDVGKGLAAVLLVARLSTWPHAPLVCGVAAIFGHTASLFIRFKGGKGVATGLGVFLGLCPIPILIGFGTFIVVVAVTHMVSAGSIAGAVALAVALYVFTVSWPIRVVASLVAFVVILKHHSNIRRILRGEENRLW